MITGVVLFALVAHFVLLPNTTESNRFDPVVSRGALVGALVLVGVSLLLFRMMPRRSADESAETFWRTAAPRAMIVWAPLEGASLIAVIVYSHGGGLQSVAVGLLAVSLFLLLNPSYFERR